MVSLAQSGACFETVLETFWTPWPEGLGRLSWRLFRDSGPKGPGRLRELIENKFMFLGSWAFRHFQAHSQRTFPGIFRHFQAFIFRGMILQDLP